MRLPQLGPEPSTDDSEPEVSADRSASQYEFMMTRPMRMSEVELALMGVVGHLVSELSKEGLLDPNSLADQINLTAAAQRTRGQPRNAEALHQFAEYLVTSAATPTFVPKKESS
jgi:hypothetical protein